MAKTKTKKRDLGFDLEPENTEAEVNAKKGRKKEIYLKFQRLYKNQFRIFPYIRTGL